MGKGLVATSSAANGTDLLIRPKNGDFTLFRIKDGEILFFAKNIGKAGFKLFDVDKGTNHE